MSSIVPVDAKQLDELCEKAKQLKIQKDVIHRQQLQIIELEAKVDMQKQEIKDLKKKISVLEEKSKGIQHKPITSITKYKQNENGEKDVFVYM